MKIEDLLEAPMIKKGNLDQSTPMRPFTSMEAIEREYEIISNDKTTKGEKYVVFIQKRNQCARIGVPGTRESDGAPGVEIFGQVDFKHVTQISGMQALKTGKNVLQVDLVRVPEKIRNAGWAFYLYLSLAKAGYVVISDHTQYTDGKELWKKIAAKVLKSKYKVYVIDNGKVRVDAHENPVVYDGSNIDEAELWSEDASKKYTLFALRSEA